MSEVVRSTFIINVCFIQAIRLKEPMNRVEKGLDKGLGNGVAPL